VKISIFGAGIERADDDLAVFVDPIDAGIIGKRTIAGNIGKISKIVILFNKFSNLRELTLFLTNLTGVGRIRIGKPIGPSACPLDLTSLDHLAEQDIHGATSTELSECHDLSDG